MYVKKQEHTVGTYRVQDLVDQAIKEIANGRFEVRFGITIGSGAKVKFKKLLEKELNMPVVLKFHFDNRGCEISTE